MANGDLGVAVIDSGTASTPPRFKANGTEVGQLCTAWVNFNGTGTVAIRDSFNVSSITDTGTGNYTVNFATAMANANYAVVAMFGNAGSVNGWAQINNTAAYSVNGVALSTLSAVGPAVTDPPYVSAAIFGGKP